MQEEKQILLKDLCGRLPISKGILVKIGNYSDYTIVAYNERKKDFTVELIEHDLSNYIEVPIEYIKPYLRPMSSMTEEEKEWIRDNFDYVESFGVRCYDKVPEYYDWLNEHHFDYRGLIEKGLAIEAPEGMYKTESL